MDRIFKNIGEILSDPKIRIRLYDKNENVQRIDVESLSDLEKIDHIQKIKNIKKIRVHLYDGPISLINRVYSSTITSFSGCRSIAIFNKALTKEQYRNKGIGTLMHEFRIRIAIALKFSMVQCTVLVGNEPQNKILFKYKWLYESTFVNRFNGNEVMSFKLYLV